jgi:hypothetical protein
MHSGYCDATHSTALLGRRYAQAFFQADTLSRCVDAFQLRDFMGPDNLATTQLYVHLGQDEARKVMEATAL